MLAWYRFAALVLALATAPAGAGGIPDPPPFDFNVVTPNADYRVGSVSTPASVHYFPPLKTIAAALALDNDATPIFGYPNGYHAGYIGRGHVEALTGHLGKFLQIRPKAAHSRARRVGIDADGAPFAALPKGFYLRPSFTGALLRRHFALPPKS